MKKQQTILDKVLNAIKNEPEFIRLAEETEAAELAAEKSQRIAAIDYLHQLRATEDQSFAAFQAAKDKEQLAFDAYMAAKSITLEKWQIHSDANNARGNFERSFNDLHGERYVHGVLYFIDRLKQHEVQRLGNIPKGVPDATGLFLVASPRLKEEAERCEERIQVLGSAYSQVLKLVEAPIGVTELVQSLVAICDQASVPYAHFPAVPDGEHAVVTLHL